MKIRIINIITVCIVFIVVVFMENKVYGLSFEQDIINETGKNFGISNFTNETNKYIEDFWNDTSVSELLNSAISGKIDNNTILKKILNIFGKEMFIAIKTLIGVLIIVLIHSILKNISEGLETSNVLNIIYYAQYILIVTLIMRNFSDIILSIINTVNNLVGFMNTLVPLLVTLMIYTGNIATSSLLEPIILFVVEFIGNLITTLILPSVSIITALIIVSKISDKIQIGKLTTFLKSSIIWFLGTILTVFVGILSLEGTLTSSVDGITAKTAKATVSSLIPVVGKILGDSVDSILGCGVVLKNAIGVVGVIIIIGICVIPIIKLAVLSIVYAVASAIIEPLADKKIVDLLSEFSGIFRLLLAILCSVSVLLIVGTTMVVKISNSGMMYR